jgi:L-amino acid N-acyltransferase YncA
MNLHIRQARPEDAEGIVAVFNPIIESGLYTTFDTPFTAEAERQYILNLKERDILHVAVRQPDEVVVGFQGLSPFPSYSRAFAHVGVMGTFVALDQRRQGIGGRLFAATFELARLKGYEKIFTYVRADNTGGLAAYLKQGFRIVGTAQNQAKIGGRYVDEIIIEKLF